MGSIKRRAAYAKNAYTYYPVVIVGAGESGIAMGCRLKEVLNFDQFRIFERQSGIGGTWWINRYPGVACDIPAIFYSFSFAQNPNWTSTHPPGQEITEYLASVCAKYGIVDKIQLHTDVRELRWLEDEEEWEVTLDHLVPGAGDLSTNQRQERIAVEGKSSVYIATEIVRAKVAINAVGALVEPNAFPNDIPGMETFEGDIFHTARWKEDVDLKGKDVIVIGTGCSAAQVVPQLVKPPYEVNSVTQLMRNPPWVIPPLMDPSVEERWNKYAPKLMRSLPGLLGLVRLRIFQGTEGDYQSIFSTRVVADRRNAVEERYLNYMRKHAPAKYHELLTPNYQIGCKRRVLDRGWFEALHHSNVQLTPQPLLSVQAQSITLGSKPLYPPENPLQGGDLGSSEAIQIPADAIILANGYRATEWLQPLRVIGRDGKSIHDVWEERGGPQAYLGIAMDKFPNFFMIFGPNTATGHSSVILASENSVNYTLKFVKSILDGTVSTWEVKEEAERKWTSRIQQDLKETTFQSGGCVSWYSDDKSWNSVIYPYSQVDASLRYMFPVWDDWTVKFRPDGIRRRRRQVLTRQFLFIAALGIYIWSKRRPAAARAMRASIMSGLTAAFRIVQASLQRTTA